MHFPPTHQYIYLNSRIDRLNIVFLKERWQHYTFLFHPQIQPIVQELLKVIKETENDDLTNVMCKIVTTYTEQLTPIAVDMCTQLAATFQQVNKW